MSVFWFLGFLLFFATVSAPVWLILWWATGTLWVGILLTLWLAWMLRVFLMPPRLRRGTARSRDSDSEMEQPGSSVGS